MAEKKVNTDKEFTHRQVSGVLAPLNTLCLTILGPTLGVIVSKEDPSMSIICAFFASLLIYTIAYGFILAKKSHLLLDDQRVGAQIEYEILTKRGTITGKMTNQTIVTKDEFISHHNK